MGEKKWGCFKQSAAGCGCLVVAAIALPLLMAAMIMVPMNRAVATRTELETVYGNQEDFTPPASGVPASERIEAFLEVRRALAPTCNDFWKAERSVAKLEAFDDQEEVSKITVLSQAMSTSKTMMGMGSSIAHFFETRNQALFDAGMGLGEYTYIYVLAYGNEILNPTDELELFGPEVANARIRKALRAMLQNQLELLQQEGGPEAAIASVSAEVEALAHDTNRILWQDGLPPAITDALVPYREELDTQFCGSTPPFELMINEKRSLAIETR